uniref:Ig-like domain-containing protein n=1 Tax=Spermophilus dauricus TaxID=99837 RepID=A0A8C9QC45_SPEDA
MFRVLNMTLCWVLSHSILLTPIVPDKGILIFLLGRSNGDSVTQRAGLVTLVEGASVILNCTYQATYSGYFLCWYVQYLDKAPQLLLKTATENQKTESRGFHATLVKKENSFHLQKPAVQPSDSAVYYCAVGGTVRGTAGGAELRLNPRNLEELELP